MSERLNPATSQSISFSVACCHGERHTRSISKAEQHKAIRGQNAECCSCDYGAAKNGNQTKQYGSPRDGSRMRKQTYKGANTDGKTNCPGVAPLGGSPIIRVVGDHSNC